eukprot:gene7152-21512_t
MGKDLQKKAIKVLTKKLGREPTEKEIAKKVKKLEAKAEAKGDDDEEESPKKEKKKSKKEKKEKKRKADSDSEAEEEPKKAKVEEPEPEAAAAAPAAGAGAPNPDGLSKCFLGNLSYDIDDDQAKEYFKDCGEITDIYWLTDKETGKFFGSGFITFSEPSGAAAAVAKAGEELLGRPLKIEFAKPKPGGDSARTPKKKYESKPLSEKPEGCLTIFCGNLSYDIDDDSCKAFFKDCGEINKIRWLTDRETGDFKGCGFVEFHETESTDKAIALNGQKCLGRDIRLDYAAAKKKEW